MILQIDDWLWLATRLGKLMHLQFARGVSRNWIIYDAPIWDFWDDWGLSPCCLSSFTGWPEIVYVAAKLFQGSEQTLQDPGKTGTI